MLPQEGGFAIMLQETGIATRAQEMHVAARVGKDGVYIRVTYIYAYCIARIQYSTRLVPRLASGASRGRR